MWAHRGESRSSPKVVALALDTPVIGQWLGDIDALVVKVPADQKDFARDLAGYYVKYATKFNLRCDLLWAMMLLETNGLRFTGKVQRGQYNYGGLKDAMGDQFATFPSPECGVIGHVAHLAWYAFPDHVNDLCNIVHDPRHTAYHPYTVTFVRDLSGKWTPSKTYAGHIVRVWNEGI